MFPNVGNQGDSEEVLRYLGVKHLFGFRDWPPLSKAMFLDKRVNSKKDLALVLKELNIKKQEAACVELVRRGLSTGLASSSPRI